MSARSVATPARARAGGRGGALRTLADAMGILPSYVAQDGRTHHTSDHTRAAILAAMGFDVADEAAAARALAALHVEERERLLDPARVAVAADARGVRDLARVEARLPASFARTVEWSLAWRDEDGRERRSDGRARAGADGRVRVSLPAPPALGYHDLRLEVAGGGQHRAGEQTLVVAPPRCPSPAELLRGERVAGIVANLYAVRSARNWGAGDTGDLATLVELARDGGLAFVGVNPLHALRNAGADVSPYGPISRLFRNVLYLDVDAIPELTDDAEARALVARPAFRRALARLRDASHVDYEAVMRLKRPVLEALHRAFARRPPGDARRREYERWVATQGEALERFATFCALDERFRALGRAWWREWPAAFQDPESPEVRAFASAHRDRVDFHRWTQFELDRQLAVVAERSRAAGLPVGLYQDLAIGTSPAGSDAWAYPSLFLRGVSVGAPPDPLGPDGQNWGLPPLDPRRLREQRYAYWSTLVRSALGHAGALRIDHALGLFRQFWIPDGMRGADGAYVRFPTEDLLGIVALEATRAGALVVGEDLGTIPPEVPPTLERWGLLGSRVLYFERERDGRFRAARDYPRLALTTATTHDLPTLAGFWRGRDVELRHAVGMLRGAGARRAAREARARDRARLLQLLVDEGIVADAAAPLDDVALRAAVHAFLRRTPSWLVGIALDDLIGETEPVNLPGVGPDRFASWTRRSTRALEELRTDGDVRRALGAERVWVTGAAERRGDRM